MKIHNYAYFEININMYTIYLLTLIYKIVYTSINNENNTNWILF